MEAYDGTETCDLVSNFLSDLKKYGKKDTSLYSDDGLAIYERVKQVN